MATPNMNLSLPTVSVTEGSLWATMLNNAFSVIDTHDHSSGKGVKIPSSGLSINADLNINGNIFYNFKATRYQQQAATLTGSLYTDSVYSVNGNLYWTNGSGTAVQLTNGASIAAVPGTVDSFEIVSASSDITIDPTDTFVIIKMDTSVDREITLPAASSVAEGRFYIVKDGSGDSLVNPITLTAQGSDIVDGESTQTLNSGYGSWTVVSDGVSEWSIV